MRSTKTSPECQIPPAQSSGNNARRVRSEDAQRETDRRTARWIPPSVLLQMHPSVDEYVAIGSVGSKPSS
ncbi:hypothetical protein DNTS_026267 [Danionella cerebrum]|uniref:Uncharacterized protein n=1 Tax=Danionella cerebrum TaxID=2873325 RepID=A0A553N5J1_9TELE|nr:hypothetical protein DNTS_026267 [Danionella translucida]